MKKVIGLVIVCILAYNSVYFKKLSDLKSTANSTFNFIAFADSLYNKGILLQEKPIALQDLQKELITNTEDAFLKYGNRLGIGQTAYFMVTIQGTISDKKDTDFNLKSQDEIVLPISTKYIFGNAIRDASQLVKLTDFNTNAEFNTLSEELNTIIREKSLPSKIKLLNNGDRIEVIGAIKQSKKEALPLTVLPVNITKLQ